MAKKNQLSYYEVEQRLAALCSHAVAADELGYGLLHAFGKTEADINRYRAGKGVVAAFPGLLVKGLMAYTVASTRQLTARLEALKRDPVVVKAAPMIVAVSDGQTLLAYDLRYSETYENTVQRLPYDFAFWYPLMGVERVQYREESPVDMKAAERLAKLHDELRAVNEFSSDADLHDLNIFIARLLFCFFAEDTSIFEPDLFTSSIKRYTRDDGSDISDYLDDAFTVMNTPEADRRDVKDILRQFPYVGGDLFAHRTAVPMMGARARRIIIDCGELNWQNINPDIFGSMIQGVVNPAERATNGMHYTSVPNIMKVIQPLFLDELRSEYNELRLRQEAAKQQFTTASGLNSAGYKRQVQPLIQRCRDLLARMSRMKFFDPACGSGNFLIITYKELRHLEMDILDLISQCTTEGSLNFMGDSAISVDQFYGIELLDFPHEIAKLSLRLAEHQMDSIYYRKFGHYRVPLPLRPITNIHSANACRVDWNKVCPHTKDEEVYVFGNPPYLGSSMQDESQKADLTYVCGSFANYKNLDYIACWFYLGALYIKGTSAKYAFVSTNSICQGDSVALLWPNIFKQGEEIVFAYQSFKWTNNAKHNAAVIVIIVGIASLSKAGKRLFDSDNNCTNCKIINAYLLDGPNIVIRRLNRSISGFQEMVFGNKPTDGGFLILDHDDKENIIREYPQAAPLIRRYEGADSYINGGERYCLWITDEQLPLARTIPPIQKRLGQVRQFRMESKAESTVLYADRPHLFKQRAHQETDAIIVPRVSSERRKYIPIGFLSKDTIINDAAQAIYNANIFIFGILCTRMQVIWTSTIGGKMKSDYRYSSLVYNSFPFPPITASQKQAIESAAEEILMVRSLYPEQTLAQLYDPDTMPDDLRDAHAHLDTIVESCYPGAPFTSDEGRLACLFKMYEKMTKK